MSKRPDRRLADLESLFKAREQGGCQCGGPRPVLRIFAPDFEPWSRRAARARGELPPAAPVLREGDPLPKPDRCQSCGLARPQAVLRIAYDSESTIAKSSRG